MEKNNKATTDEHRVTQIQDHERFNPITEKVIGCAYTASNILGVGFLEKVYENALAHELRKAGLQVRQQFPIQVKYDQVIVGEPIADLFVEDCVLVELKAVKALEDIHQAQCINYLKATGTRLFLLLNDGTARLGIKRIVF